MIRTLYQSDPKIPGPRTPSYDGDGPLEYRAARRIGLELRWTEEFTLVLRNVDGKVTAEYDFLGRKSREVSDCVDWHTMADVYAVALNQQIALPKGFNALLLPHPRFFEPRLTGTYSDFPFVIPTLVEADWNPSRLWLHCNYPPPGTEHIFYAGEPIAHFVTVPRGDVTCSPMDDEDSHKWLRRRKFLEENIDASRKIKQFGWESVRT